MLQCKLKFPPRHPCQERGGFATYVITYLIEDVPGNFVFPDPLDLLVDYFLQTHLISTLFALSMKVKQRGIVKQNMAEFVNNM